MKGDMKDNQNVFILTSDAYDSCSQAPYTSITFHFFTETIPFSAGCLLANVPYESYHPHRTYYSGKTS